MGEKKKLRVAIDDLRDANEELREDVDGLLGLMHESVERLDKLDPVGDDVEMTPRQFRQWSKLRAREMRRAREWSPGHPSYDEMGQ